MWWDIVPSAALVTFFLTVPFITVPSVHWLFMGKPCKRGPNNPLEKDLWRRDQSLDPKGDGHKTLYWTAFNPKPLGPK